jgi:hypothetical protein
MRRTRQACDPHGHVETFFDQVDEPVRERDVQFDLGVLCHESGPQPGQMHETERDRHIDPQQPARVAAARGDLGFGFGDVR